MATPRVFISSTWYDLKYIRENIKYFVRTLGYEPILSEDGSVFYDPRASAAGACLSEIPNCQLFVLIIGGRYGSDFPAKAKSVTNEEYRAAIKQKIPVFALVEAATLSDFELFRSNRDNDHVDESKIVYPAADNTRIFGFIDEVRLQTANNAFASFRDFSDIEKYLKLQWAGMMHSFLVGQNEERRVADMMSELVRVNEKVEFLSNQILKSVGSEKAKLLVEMYEKMITNAAIRTLINTGHKPDPIVVLESETLEDCARRSGAPFKIVADATYSSSSDGSVSAEHLKEMEPVYAALHKDMLASVKNSGHSIATLKPDAPKKR